MTASERYGVFLKALGIWTVVAGLTMLPTATRELHKYNDSQEFFYMMMDSIAGPAIMVLAGYWLLFSTDWIARTTYPEIAHTSGDEISVALPNSAGEELLATLLKILGILSLVPAISSLPSTVAQNHRTPFTGTFFYGLMMGFGPVIAQIACALLLLISTTWIVRIAFRNDEFLERDADKNDARTITPKELLVVVIKALAVWSMINGVRYLPFAAAELHLYSRSWPSIYAIAQTLAYP